MSKPKPHLVDTTFRLVTGIKMPTRCKVDVMIGEILTKWDSGELPELDSRGICPTCLGAEEPKGIHAVYVVSERRANG